MKKTLEMLNKIQRVETPPFLYTRVESKINEVIKPVYSFKVITSMSFALLFLAIANFSILQNDFLANQETESDISVVVEQINNSNQLYNE